MPVIPVMLHFRICTGMRNIDGLPVTDVQAVPTGAGLLWQLIGPSVGGGAAGGSERLVAALSPIAGSGGVNKFYIAGITLLLDSIGGWDAVRVRAFSGITRLTA